jgi:hypothetical protein
MIEMWKGVYELRLELITNRLYEFKKAKDKDKNIKLKGM